MGDGEVGVKQEVKEWAAGADSDDDDTPGNATQDFNKLVRRASLTHQAREARLSIAAGALENGLVDPQEKRRATDSKMYTHAEFLEFFGESEGRQNWVNAG